MIRLTPYALRKRGVSLIEVLLGIVVVTIASIATLSYFAYGMGGIGKTGNRRAALERARQRLEQLMEAGASQLAPQDGLRYCCNAVSCTAATWVACPADPLPDHGVQVPVDDLPAQRLETTAQMIDDPSAGTATLDTLELGAKVWFTSDTVTDDDHHRVYLKTLRTP